MKLYIMRHGEAVSGTPDVSRALDVTGQQEVARMAEWLFSAMDDETRPRLHIVASPYDRAQQTARIMSRQLQVDDVMALPLITPDAPVESVIEWLADNVGVGADDAPWMLVSHMPLVAELTGRLVDGGPQARLPMGTADIVELEAEVWADGCARLVRHVTPDSATIS
ncbi:phosphohistidine phosphatase SixA [Kushneria sinocarnis]|uniref:Phosphohistidine phosphatase SixA n=1 Tax=Kushneria sinocarnis TaxID=595502 RepID=A0A420WUV2_9GAMM|nr:phosphohistidine phosphatase SixA [Kushneria sinocarnis]RKQ97218.1 phosphohistidine phosphatase SixA [Kushneria sinocarnis]